MTKLRWRLLHTIEHRGSLTPDEVAALVSGGWEKTGGKPRRGAARWGVCYADKVVDHGYLRRQKRAHADGDEFVLTDAGRHALRTEQALPLFDHRGAGA